MNELQLYKNMELNIIPLLQKSKKPAIDWKKYQTEKYFDDFQLDCNLGIVCGTTSGNLVVIDLDSPELLDEFREYLDSTIVVKTGKKGYHIYLRILGRLPNTLRLTNKKKQHIDVQSSGTYVVAAPSIHPDTGTKYEIISSTLEIQTLDFAKIIEKLEKLGFAPDIAEKSAREIMKGQIQEGDRHNSALRYCNFLLFAKKLDSNAVQLEMKNWNSTLHPPLSEDELSKIIDDCMNYHSENTESEDEPEKKTAVQLYKLVKTRIKKVVVSEENESEVYIIIKNHDHCESVNADSVKARQWLKKIFFDETGKIVSDEYYKQALSMVKAQARFNESSRARVYNRIAQTYDTIFYDLCTFDWKAIKITKNSIILVDLDDTTPIMTRSQHNARQVYPNLDTDIDALGEITRILHIQDPILFSVHTVSFFLEFCSIPIMILLGAAGSLKTTISFIEKLIVDPDGKGIESNVSPFSHKEDDLNIHVYNRYLSAFDNITGIPQKIADNLCRFVTGQSYTKRKLYQDSEETILNFRRKLILNGIAPTIEQSDLIQRSIFYRQKGIAKQDRITERELASKLEMLLPDVLGQIFKTLQKAMNLYDTVEKEIQNPERMSDFTIWGECISRALGYEPFKFVESYNKNLEDNYLSAGDSHPIVEYLEKIVTGEITHSKGSKILKEGETYFVSVSDFHFGLKEFATDKGFDTHSKFSTFPKHPNKLASHVLKIKPILDAAKLTVSFKTYTKNDGKFKKNNTIIIIKRKNSQDGMEKFHTD
jgi:hypothetical protein